ncbi:hypothetical protein OS189_09735 [Sulfitobacter sp. F26169L]|uniref:hypothetical protein n=1 Tax=Sulfitobacter sp. F26169L TaxID=2996015 RepID=UPI0022608342|nr:hypothetical protein [Sulfitobacter sp. F26169L]MCX7566621.1 hypothetical protein [Sulfitobacter sp. F26169L]
MKAAVCAVMVSLAPVQALALSCMPHSIEAAFQRAKSDPAEFSIVKGVLEFDARKLPKAGYNKQKPSRDATRIKAAFTGASLSRKGFATPFSSPVTLSVACFGPWCASAPHGTEVLAFVEIGADGYVVSTNPCGGFLFDTPTPEMIDTVKRCFAGQRCQPPR